MIKLVESASVAAMVLGLAACGSPPSDEAATPSGAASPAAVTATTEPAAAATTAAATTAAAGARPAAFNQCVTCHAVEPGKNSVGPSLFGVVGRQAGTVAGYAYSDANKNSHLTWDEATLDTYLTAPMKKIPGTKMAFAGIADPAKRKEVIEYLKTLK